MASRARFPSAFSGVNTSALATSATSSDSPAPAMSVQKRPMYRPAVCISSSIAVAGTPRARSLRGRCCQACWRGCTPILLKTCRVYLHSSVAKIYRRHIANRFIAEVYK